MTGNDRRGWGEFARSCWSIHLWTKLGPRPVETTWTGCEAWSSGRWSAGVSWVRTAVGTTWLTDSPPVADIVKWEVGKVK